MKKLNNRLNLITLELTLKKLIEQYLGPGAFTDRRWMNKVVINIIENVSGTS